MGDWMGFEWWTGVGRCEDDELFELGPSQEMDE